MSYPPPAPRTSFQGHRVEGNMKVDDVHANIFQGHRVSVFGLELDGGKAWRRRLPGASEGGYEHRIGARILFYFYRDSEGAFGRESATRGGSFGKAWRGRLPGALEGGCEHRIGARILCVYYIFIGIQRGRLGGKVQPRGGSFWC